MSSTSAFQELLAWKLWIFFSVIHLKLQCSWSLLENQLCCFSLIQECRTPAFPLPTQAHGWWVVSWGWRWGGGFALIWKSLWCRGRGHLQRCYMWQVFGKFLPHPSGVRVKQILLQTSRCQKEAVQSIVQPVHESASRHLAGSTLAPKLCAFLQEQLLASSPSTGSQRRRMVLSISPCLESCGPISIIPGPWGYVSGHECHCVTGRCKPGCLAVPRGNAAPYSWAVDLLVVFPEALLSKSAASHLLESRLSPNSSHMPAIEKRATGARTWRQVVIWVSASPFRSLSCHFSSCCCCLDPPLSPGGASGDKDH